jgi:hypothetical protein
MEVFGIKITHVSLGKGELVRIERDKKSTRVYVKFDGSEESNSFGFGSDFFKFFSVDSVEDKKKIEEYINQMETEKKEAEDKKAAERLAEQTRINDARGRAIFSTARTTKTSTKSVGKSSGVTGYKMTKSEAKKILEGKGYYLPTEFTLAANNKAVDIYWANPRITLTKKKWTLVLNNKNTRELMVFVMDPNDAVVGSTVRAEISKLVTRNDKNDMIDVRIFVNDLDFEEMSSRVKFAPFKVFETNY